MRPYQHKLEALDREIGRRVAFMMTYKMNIRKAKEGVSRAINSRREILLAMRQYLRNPATAKAKYWYTTIYSRGPEIVKEIAQLKKVRSDLKRIIDNVVIFDKLNV